jgi:uncharacterized protein YabE (DUF348 family)/3D (Asp-Asp-Asp) domain-containing protein
MKGVLFFMTTQEKEKLELLREMRQKREAKKQAKKRARHRRRVTALVLAVTLSFVTFGTMYSASAKEITVTEIDEFSGVNESRTFKTRSDVVEDALEEHGFKIGENDKLNVPAQKPISDNEDIVLKRGKRVTIKMGDYEQTVTVTKADVNDALVEAGFIPGEYDKISVINDKINDGDVIELVSIGYDNEVVTEKIEREIEYVDDPTLLKGEEKVIDEGEDGVKEIVHKITYQNGEEAERETTSETVTSAPRNKVIAKGTATPTPSPQAAKPTAAPSSKSTVDDNGGSVNGYKYKKKITMTATAYGTSAAENGGYAVSAMGNSLGYGIVAVDPNVVPLGSKVYVTSADGSWTYGVASAEDTGTAIRGNRIDLCYPSDALSFGRRSCVVYILE